MNSDINDHQQNPYRSGVAGHTPLHIESTPVRVTPIVVMQLSFLLLIGLGMLILAPAIQRLLQDFEINLSDISAFALFVSAKWHIALPILVCLSVVSIIIYIVLARRSSALSNTWWFSTLFLWICLTAVLAYGVLSPLWTFATGLTDS
jgi:type II secretory pathway component PulF